MAALQKSTVYFELNHRAAADKIKLVPSGSDEHLRRTARNVIYRKIYRHHKYMNRIVKFHDLLLDSTTFQASKTKFHVPRFSAFPRTRTNKPPCGGALTPVEAVRVLQLLQRVLRVAVGVEPLDVDAVEVVAEEEGQRMGQDEAV